MEGADEGSWEGEGRCGDGGQGSQGRAGEGGDSVLTEDLVLQRGEIRNGRGTV